MTAEPEPDLGTRSARLLLCRSLRQTWFRRVALAFTCLTPATALAAGAFPEGPYLQHLGPSSVEIRVGLAVPAAASVDVETAGHAKRTIVDSGVVDFHSFHVPDLTPLTRYRYVVHSGALTSEPGEFVTAPADGAKDPFTILLYGDTRGDPAVHATVVHAIQQEGFDLLIHTGDFVLAGGREPLWREFFDLERSLLRDHCVFACVGNHELFEDNEAAHFERYFGPTDSGEPPKLYGSFRWGDARVFLLNAFQDWSSGDERAWLEKALRGADAEPGLLWRFAVIHHSPWSAGRHGDNAPLLAAGIVDLLIAHHVDLVLAGHDHIYERGESKGLKYVISGGGGAPLYTEISPKPSTRKVEATYNYVLFRVTPETVTLTAKRPDGSVIDQSTFGRGANWDSAPKSGGEPAIVTSAVSAAAPPNPPIAPSSSTARCACSMPGTAPRADLEEFGLAVLGLWVTRRRVGKRRRSRG
jgi:predicted phosphodiesterase